MVILPIKEEDMQFVGDVFCLPMTLTINFSLFQYLVTFFFKRRNESRGALLIFCSFGCFATLVPYAHPNFVLVGHLNDCSETLSVLTFLLQIIIVGRDVNKKVRIRSLKYVSIAGEILVLIGLLVVLLNTLEVMDVDVSAFDGVDNIFEDITLWFIFFARFFYIVLPRGVKETLRKRKLDIILHLLFVTHEYPFVLLELLTGVSWEGAQALWNRLTIMICVVLTIREKLRSASSKQSKVNNTNLMNTTRGPQEKSLFVSDNDTTTASPAVVKNKQSTLASLKVAAPSFKSVLVGASVKPTKGQQ